MIDGRQIQAARALLGWSQRQLAEAAELSVPTVQRAEGAARLRASAEAHAAIRAALEAAGVVFLDPNGGGPGVRLAAR
ncbi:multiprotein-bridging factor 1 family protein [Rhodosalinus sp. K401]|uniref:helix-turn-helix domain-containing protein n=1 Tax=Rhodosalinus sp. K401 TaxID=3239195 RepID=UPI003526B91B